MTFPGLQPRTFFSFFLLCWWFPSYKRNITLSLCLKTWQTTEPHATINYMGFWQVAGWLCRFESGQVIEKEKPHASLSPPTPPCGIVPGPSQLLCLPKGLDTVAQLAPTGPWHQPGPQPNQLQKTDKKATNNRPLSLFTSTPPQRVAFSTRSEARGQNPKRQFIFSTEFFSLERLWLKSIHTLLTLL